MRLQALQPIQIVRSVAEVIFGWISCLTILKTTACCVPAVRGRAKKQAISMHEQRTTCTMYVCTAAQMLRGRSVYVLLYFNTESAIFSPGSREFITQNSDTYSPVRTAVAWPASNKRIWHTDIRIRYIHMYTINPWHTRVQNMNICTPCPSYPRVFVLP